MAGDLPLRTGLVTEGQRADGEHTGKAAADTVGRIRVVIAGDPDPIAPALERSKRGAIRGCQARGTGAVVKAVAERNH